jgi:hypothetical protein
MKNLSHFSKTDILAAWYAMLDLFPRRGWGRWSDDLLVLGAGSKSQSGEQHGHDHDLFQKFQSIRLLSSQVAPVRLGGEPSRSNAFLHFFELTQIGRTGLL